MDPKNNTQTNNANGTNITVTPHLGGNTINTLNGNIGVGITTPVSQNAAAFFGGNVNVTNNRPNLNPNNGGGYSVVGGIKFRF